MPQPTPVSELTFRQGMEELEQIVKDLEGDTLELEESLVKYERGVELLQFLKSRLNGAEQHVVELMDKLSDNVDDASRDSTLS